MRPSRAVRNLRRFIFDIETDGFLEELTKVHSLVIKNCDTGERFSYAHHHDYLPIEDGVRRLMTADEIIGHNVIGFDVPALKKVYPWFDIDRDKVSDTIVMAKLYKGNVKEEDLAPRYVGTPRRGLFGQQALKAWGIRLGCHKGDYDGGFDHWSKEMQDYCEQDVEVTFKLWQMLCKLPEWPRAEELEHEAAWVCAQIERNPIRFNVEKAAALYGQLAELREKLANELKTLFQPWVVFQGEVTSKASNKKHGHSIGAVFSKIKINEFNPRSRDHIANRLTAKYGWKPEQFTDGGKAQIDEQVLAALDYPEAKQLAELFLVQKRIDQIAEGDEAWLKHEKNGWIRHRLNPNGAVTARATHSKFNITQVPRVGSRYGKECREMFETVAGWALLGTDAAGLELRALSHYMSRYDNGAYGKAVVEGREDDGTDVHSLNTKALGMVPQHVYTIGGKQQKGRSCGKTFIYAFLYGAGDKKIGKILGKGQKEGRRVKLDFLKNTPALKKLKEAVIEAARRGYLIALDGRHIHVRSEHAALNSLLQSAGAIICKKWMVETERLLLAHGLKHGWDGDFAFLIWAHDELQIAVRPGLDTGVVADAASKAMKITEEFFKFKVPLDVGAPKIGNNWAETH